MNSDFFIVLNYYFCYNTEKIKQTKEKKEKKELFGYCKESAISHFQGWKNNYFPFSTRPPPLDAHITLVTETGFIPMKFGNGEMKYVHVFLYHLFYFLLFVSDMLLSPVFFIMFSFFIFYYGFCLLFLIHFFCLFLCFLVYSFDKFSAEKFRCIILNIQS